jgi:lipopolysaccharide biosynthesis regulator YciM
METADLVIIALAALVVAGALWGAWAWLRVRGPGSDTPGTAYTRALTALIEGDRRAAVRALKEAVQHDSDNLDAYIRLGDLLRESGDPARALAIHRDLTVRPRLTDSDRVRILTSLTRDHLAAGRYEEAGRSAERLREVDRTQPFAHEALRQVAENLGDWERAVAAVDEQAKLRGGDGGDVARARFRVFVGEREVAEGNSDAGRKRFQEALKLDPASSEARERLGDLALSDGHIEEAVDQWKQVALENPDAAYRVFERLERAYFELGQFGEVVAFYREILHRATPEHAVPALLALAEIHRRKGELDEAEDFLKEALGVDPNRPRTHRHMIRIALDRGDLEAARTRLDHLLDVWDRREREETGGARP